MRSRLMAMAVCVGFGALALHAQGGRTREWLTWGGDQERTGWNRGETAISKQNVKRLALKWKTQVDKEVSIEIESGNSMLTTPLVAQNVRTPRGSRTVLYKLFGGQHHRGARCRDRQSNLAEDHRSHG